MHSRRTAQLLQLQRLRRQQRVLTFLQAWSRRCIASACWHLSMVPGQAAALPPPSAWQWQTSAVCGCGRFSSPWQPRWQLAFTRSWRRWCAGCARYGCTSSSTRQVGACLPVGPPSSAGQYVMLRLHCCNVTWAKAAAPMRHCCPPSAWRPCPQANIQRARSHSPRRSTSPASVPPPGPWLPGRSSAQDSKHRRSRSGSPGLQPRPKVGDRFRGWHCTLRHHGVLAACLHILCIASQRTRHPAPAA